MPTQTQNILIHSSPETVNTEEKTFFLLGQTFSGNFNGLREIPYCIAHIVKCTKMYLERIHLKWLFDKHDIKINIQNPTLPTDFRDIIIIDQILPKFMDLQEKKEREI